MGTGTVVGIVAALVAVFGSMIMEGGNPTSLVAPPALLLITVGTFGAACAGTSLERAVDALVSCVAAFTARPADRVAVIGRLAGYADVARREGLLALEAKVADEPDPMLAAGIRSLVDGGHPGSTRALLETIARRDRKVWDDRAEFFDKMGGYAPTLGIIGTVLGLIHTLESLGGDPAELGHLIAAAFIATFFGVTFANLLFLPLAAKLKAVGADQLDVARLIIAGIELIAEGSSMRTLNERLAAHLDPGTAQDLLAREAA